jgi:hypothetical protein
MPSVFVHGPLQSKRQFVARIINSMNIAHASRFKSASAAM